MSNQDLLFSKFVQFVEDLNNVFGAKFKSIKMYHIVVNKLKELHESETNSGDTKERIDQHIKILCDFIKENNQAILSQDENLFVQPQIKYSDSIYIDVLNILKNTEEKSAIWKHLLLLESLYDPASNAREILDKLLIEDTEENKLIKNIASKLENPDVMSKISNMNPSSNPFDMIQTLSSSGLMDSLMGGLTGDLQKADPKKLIGTMRNMLDVISTQLESSDPNSELKLPF
jgi:hypothetical protein